MEPASPFDKVMGPEAQAEPKLEPQPAGNQIIPLAIQPPEKKSKMVLMVSIIVVGIAIIAVGVYFGYSRDLFKMPFGGNSETEIPEYEITEEPVIEPNIVEEPAKPEPQYEQDDFSGFSSSELEANNKSSDFSGFVQGSSSIIRDFDYLGFE